MYHVASDPHISIFNFLFFCYETMSYCSYNCWIDRNSAVLCFKRPFHIIGVWTFARFVRPHVAIILYVKFGPCVYNVSLISILAKRKRWPKKKHVTAPIMKPTDDQKLETFSFGLINDCYKEIPGHKLTCVCQLPAQTFRQGWWPITIVTNTDGYSINSFDWISTINTVIIFVAGNQRSLKNIMPVNMKDQRKCMVHFVDKGMFPKVHLGV